MNLKKEYTKLYRHWIAEFDQAELTPLFQKDFNAYKNSVNIIINFEIQEDDSLKQEILNTYKYNFEYLFEDLLKMRKIKIMNAALSLQEINIEYLLEPEKLLYQNLVRSVKGYEKLKKLSFIEDYPTENLDIETYPPIQKIVQNEIEKDGQIKTEANDQMVSVENEAVIMKKDVKTLMRSNFETESNYIIIRFLKDTPPLVGIDLKNYGPFKENDIANMPYKNAIILLNEKFAEKVELS
jgi:DNA replication initiation complex subunit (GINS family)